MKTDVVSASFSLYIKRVTQRTNEIVFLWKVNHSRSAFFSSHLKGDFGEREQIISRSIRTGFICTQVKRKHERPSTVLWAIRRNLVSSFQKWRSFPRLSTICVAQNHFLFRTSCLLWTSKGSRTFFLSVASADNIRQILWSPFPPMQRQMD